MSKRLSKCPRKTLRRNFVPKNCLFRILCGLRAANFCHFGKNFSVGTSKLHTKCPKKDFEEEFFLESFETFLDVESIFFGISVDLLGSVVKLAFYVSINYFGKIFVPKNFSFLILFGIERNVLSWSSNFFRRRCQHDILHVHGKIWRRKFALKSSLFEIPVGLCATIFWQFIEFFLAKVFLASV